MKKITSLIDILSARAEKSPERVIYRFLEYKNGKWEMQNITMRSLYHKSLEIAYALRKKGLRPGDRAVIFSMQDYGTTCDYWRARWPWGGHTRAALPVRRP